jgi:N-formylglutamate amidohydrolase
MQKPLSFSHFERLVIHTPHAGHILPVQRKNQIIYALHNVLCDHYTDKLFGSNDPSISHISFPYSRLFCDVERLLNDPLEKRGIGILYDLSYHLSIPRDKSIWAMTDEQRMTLYHAYHKALSITMENGGLLLDCHSFSEQDNILSKHAHKYKDIDICLGYNNDTSKPDEETLKLIVQFFRLHGYSVALNKPFSNAMVAGFGHHSLMIEVNKHCYMREDTLQITSGYYKLHRELQELYRLLLAGRASLSLVS